MRHEEARSAEAALEGMGLLEGGLDRVEAVERGEALDGAQRATVGLDGEQQAGADGLAVELHRARAADAVLAADVRAVEAGVVADEVGEEQARGDLGLVAVAR